MKMGSLSTVVGWWKAHPRENEIRSLFLYVQSDKNSCFEVFKVSEAKGISLNDFDEIVSGFQFGIWIGEFQSVYNLVLLFQKGLKHSPEERMDARNALLDKFKEVFGLFLLKMEKEQLV